MSDSLHDDVLSHAIHDTFIEDNYGTSRSNAHLAGHPSRLAPGAAFDAEWYAATLAHLGAVLWLVRRPPHRPPTHATQTARGALLFEHPALRVLAACTRASAHVQPTPQGLREWIEWRDAQGTLQARLFLLPDSDYLAWETLTSGIAAHATAPTPRTSLLRRLRDRLAPRWQAHLVCFDYRALPWLRLLDLRPPLRLSLLGLDLAQRMARDAGARLAPLGA